MQETKAGWGLGNKTDVCRCLGQLALLSFSCIHLVFSCCGLVTIVLTVNQCNIQTKDDYPTEYSVSHINVYGLVS